MVTEDIENLILINKFLTNANMKVLTIYWSF